jgi:hypothetical protein
LTGSRTHGSDASRAPFWTDDTIRRRKRVANALRASSDGGVPIRFLRGNRDLCSQQPRSSSSTLSTTSAWITCPNGGESDVVGYAVFGKVVSGMDVIDKIAAIETGPSGAFANNVPKTPVIIEKASAVQ